MRKAMAEAEVGDDVCNWVVAQDNMIVAVLNRFAPQRKKYYTCRAHRSQQLPKQSGLCLVM